MKIIIFGANELSSMIASELYTENDITVIDDEHNRVDAFNKLDVGFVPGNGSNIEVLKQAAQDNISMGLDMLTTATDSLELVSSHLSRIRDLAEQAANGTYGDDSLNAIQQEVNSRTAEINRIMANTEYVSGT